MSGGTGDGGELRAAVVTEVGGWLAEQWDPDLSLVEWRRRLAASGWAVPSWPRRWGGRELPAWADGEVAAAIAGAGAVGLPVGSGVGLAAPTILAHGSDAVRARFLPPIVTGEEIWCQLFSEPGAGSDLAGLTTTAVRDGDEWVVNGQKVWTTSAHHADFGLLVARTDWDAPKHRGLTYFALPMRQPGVEARPLRQMNDHRSFNEVFLTDARIPAAWTIGEPGEGWRVALTTLAHERRFGTLGRPVLPSSTGRVVSEAHREADAHFATYDWYPQRAGRVDLVVERARATGRSADPVVRQSIARLLSWHSTGQWTARRAEAARRLGRQPGAEGSIGKLGRSVVARQAAAVHAMLAGASGTLSGADGPLDGVIAEVLVSVPAQSIAGGTDEIQRNILAERMLGLPREPAPDKDIPFRAALRSS
ncbi:acyl-CoA dehydrogenase family protein [Desertimonas flava]|uniref:acyl-CoA dehydrogenase family protein n=1 Tax=Desertimonas flava TaxID=2064846 RepID=UPI001968FF87|nr:acyl-CoA dehydrogenase family protein [Desertimonas flava]